MDDDEDIIAEDPKKQVPKRFIDLKIGLAGAFLFAFGFCWVLYQTYVISIRTKVTATVINVKSIHSTGPNGSSHTYSPTIQFKTAKGLVTATPAFSSSQFNFDKGDKIPVVYDPADPQDFQIITFMAFWSWPVIGMLVGLGIIWIARCIR